MCIHSKWAPSHLAKGRHECFDSFLVAFAASKGRANVPLDVFLGHRTYEILDTPFGSIDSIPKHDEMTWVSV